MDGNEDGCCKDGVAMETMLKTVAGIRVSIKVVGRSRLVQISVSMQLSTIHFFIIIKQTNELQIN